MISTLGGGDATRFDGTVVAVAIVRAPSGRRRRNQVEPFRTGARLLPQAPDPRSTLAVCCRLLCEQHGHRRTSCCAPSAATTPSFFGACHFAQARPDRPTGERSTPTPASSRKEPIPGDEENKPES